MFKLSPTRTIIRGDSDKFRITFAKKNGNSNVVKNSCGCVVSSTKNTTPIDITGWSVRFTVRPEVPDSSVIGDDDALISEEAAIVDGKNGVALIYVQSENTTALIPGTYLYDIQVVKPIDEYGYQQVSSIRRGKYIVLGDISRNQDAITTDDFEIVYDESEGMVHILNGIWGIGADDKIIISNAIVISDIDGDVTIKSDRNTLKYITPQFNEGEDALTSETDNADDGYTI